MTAKLTARKIADLVTDGEVVRILVQRESDAQAKWMEREPVLGVTSKVTTGQVVRVLSVTSELDKGAGRRAVRYYTLHTSDGPVVLVAHNTVTLAPETPAAIKRAHVEALAEDLAREEASDARALYDQADAWFARHAALGTDTTQAAYPTIAYRAADHEEALIENAARVGAELDHTLAEAESWERGHDRVNPGRRGWAFAVRYGQTRQYLEDLAEAAQHDNRARDWYAHMGYGLPLSAATIASGYTDWDTGRATAQDRLEAYAATFLPAAPLDRWPAPDVTDGAAWDRADAAGQISAWLGGSGPHGVAGYRQPLAESERRAGVKSVA
jgi:hypothetical protein